MRVDQGSGRSQNGDVGRGCDIDRLLGLARNASRRGGLVARLSDSSDEELTVEILRRWHGLRQAVPQEMGWLRKLSELSGTSIRTLDWVRRTRNRLAHPEAETRHLVTRQDLIRALGILDRAERNIKATPRPRPKKSTATRDGGRNSARRTGTTRNRSGSRENRPSRLTRTRDRRPTRRGPQRRKRDNPASQSGHTLRPARETAVRFLTRVRNIEIADAWERGKVPAAIALGVLVVFLVIYNYGIVGLLLAPFIVIGIIIALYLMLWLIAIGCLIAAIVYFTMGDHALTATLFLWGSLIAFVILSLLRDW
jgi:hypothetical protein